MSPSSLVDLAALVPYAEDDDYMRSDDRLRRRDFIWQTSHSASQNLCGISSTYKEAHSDEQGPWVSDCTTFVNAAKTLNGTWFVSNFGSTGQTWVHFAEVRSCRVAVRHSDGGHGAIP